MIYAFDHFRLDTDKGALFADGAAVPVEPQVLALLRLLIENRARLVSKDEIIERIWNGRAISDSALASRIKSARQALGDDGQTQRYIKTAHKLGFRFVGAIEEAPVVESVRELAPPPVQTRTRPSIAVLPFTVASAFVRHGAIAEALPHDLIVELSRLRWLFVIARGSSFQFRGADAVEKVAATLGVAYCLTGAVELDGDVMTITVELSDARAGEIVWSERFRAPVDAVHEVRASIVQSVLGALELQIPLNEAKRALKSPDNLDAWSAYHLGLHHMFRFSREGNELAATYFQRAADSEPGFARAYAGLSFAHFENAFLRTADDTRAAADMARRHAEKALEFDPLDPFCNLVMGRTYWLSGDLEGALPWLDRAIELNPNYAQAKYSRAWTETLLGFGADGQANVETAMALSPLDPLLYGMLAVKGFARIVQGEPDAGALWAERAARAPRAHPLIELVAAAAHELNGDGVKARGWAASALARHPGLSAQDFLTAFPFREPEIRARVAAALARLGL